MKYFRYKQICRLNFFGYDDELSNVSTSYYNTPFKKLTIPEINTKLLRFRIENLKDIKLSQHAKLTLESVFIPSIFDLNNSRKVLPLTILKLKNLSDSNNYDSTNSNSDGTVIFSGCLESETQNIQTLTGTSILPAHKTGLNFINTNADKLYTFTIPQNFTNNSIFEFEILYHMLVTKNLTLSEDAIFFQRFQCSLVIYDVEEAELLSSAGEEVDFSKIKPQLPVKPKY